MLREHQIDKIDIATIDNIETCGWNPIRLVIFYQFPSNISHDYLAKIYPAHQASFFLINTSLLSKILTQ